MSPGFVFGHQTDDDKDTGADDRADA